MKKYIIKIIRHPLITGSTIVFFGSFGGGLLNLLFTLLLGRFLVVSEYGVYSSLISLLGIIGIFPSAFTTIFAKFAATYNVKKESGDLNALLLSGSRIVLLFSTCVSLLLFVSVFQISSFLHIGDIRLLFLTFLIIFISILFSLPNGVLQGQMRFYILSFFNIFSPLLKIFIGFLLLFLGLKVYGVILAIFLSSIVPFILVFVLFWKHYKTPTKVLIDESSFFNEFKNYSLKFFLATLGITILTTTDVMFVKHFFTPEEAGQYAALSVMGKSIFYLFSPIYFVFFPLIAQKQAKKESVYETLMLAACIITMCSTALSFVYFFFPQIILGIFFPAKGYNVLASYLGPFSLYIIVFSNAMLFNTFLLSIGKSGIYIINLVVALLFMVLMYVFHSSFFQIIGVLFSTSFLLLSLHLLYYILSIKKENYATTR